MCIRASVLTCLLAAVLGLAPVQEFPPRLLPIDQAKLNPSFAKFRRELLAAAKAGDIETVLSAVTSNIQVGSTEENRGVAALRRDWQIDASPHRFLAELVTILSLGGAFTDGRFCAPYVSARFPLDPLEYGAIVTNDVALYAQPDTKSAVLTRLSYNIVTPDHGDIHPRRGWIKIRTFTNQVGYVPADSFRSPLDTEACFMKTGGKWMMISFMSGD